MTRSIPVVEVTDDRDRHRVGSPHRELDTLDAIDRSQMRAELLVELEMVAFVEEIEVFFAQEGALAMRRDGTFLTVRMLPGHTQRRSLSVAAWG